MDRPNRRTGFFKIVSPSYFGTLGIRLAAGRFLEASDRAGAPPVLLINQTMAERAGMYVSNAQSPTYGVSLLVRTGLDPRSLEPAVRDAIEDVNPDQAMSRVRTLEQIQSESVFGERFLSALLGSFAALALLLASIGIYGVIAYSVSQRTQELGVRSALGANAGNLRMQVFVGGMRLAAIGLVIGVVGALVLARVMSSFVFDVSVYDPVTLAAVMLVLSGVAAAACFVPVRRASRIDPMAALRCQ